MWELAGACIVAAYLFLVLLSILGILYRLLVERLAWRMVAYAGTRPPDLIIGGDDPYLMRWELARFLGCQLALHHIQRSDDDRAPHDHVSWHLSLILVAGYLEHVHGKIKWRRPGQIVFRKALTPHRLELPTYTKGGVDYAWTLWLRGPKWRDWGFYCAKGWVQWEQFGKTGCD
jgi:hypothetical protein